MGRVSQVRSLTPNFRIVAFKMWDYSSSVVKIANIANFWYNFAKRDFYKIWLEGGESQVRTFLPNFTIVPIKMWAYSSQSSQNC